MNYENLGMVLGALFFILGGLATLLRGVTNLRKEREEENQKILTLANEYCDAKCKILEQEISHQKNINEGKISELSEKIEQLREEMRNHHTQLVNLLTKMIEKE